MKTFATDTHRLHFPDRELAGGEFVRPYECPERWQHVVDALANRDFSSPEEPQALPDGLLEQVHGKDYFNQSTEMLI